MQISPDAPPVGRSPSSGSPSSTNEKLVATVDELVELIGLPTAAAAGKERPALHDLDRQWLADSPLCFMATADADGACDVSPKGDPAGQLAYAIDDTTLAIAERPGNRRADGYRNILVNPYVGLLFVIPGRGDTLRINGRARLVSDAPYFDAMIVKGHRPVLAVVVDIEQVFHHCAKALMRSQVWRPGSWHHSTPSRPTIAQALERPDETLADLEAYYGPSYQGHLY